MLGKMAKVRLKYLKKKRSFIRMANRLLMWVIHKKGAINKKEFSTYGMGIQVSYCVGDKEET